MTLQSDLITMRFEYFFMDLVYKKALYFLDSIIQKLPLCKREIVGMHSVNKSLHKTLVDLFFM